MLEFEKKCLLSEEEYRVLLAPTGKHPVQTVQTNYYYDTENLDGNKKGITYRIRESQGKCVATVKAHRTGIRNGSSEQTRAVSHPFESHVFGVVGLRLQGCLTTLRTVLFREEGIEAVLDKNVYLDRVDHELEVEYTPENAAKAEERIGILRRILLERRISQKGGLSNGIYNHTSKSERFFNRLSEIRQCVPASGQTEKVYRVTDAEMQNLIRSARGLFRSSGELLSAMEHLTQLQEEKREDYDPDDYSELLYRIKKYHL